jgi:Mg2+-importing ATPase
MTEKIISSKQPHNQDRHQQSFQKTVGVGRIGDGFRWKRRSLTGFSHRSALQLATVWFKRVGKEKPQSVLMHLINNLKNPLVILLVSLAVLSYLTGDLRATVVISVMVVLGVVLRFFQEMRADNAAAALKAMVVNKATVVRDGKELEISLKMLVPGDIITIAAGDMIPADVRIISAKDLFLDQAALTGEAMPVEKKSDQPQIYG